MRQTLRHLDARRRMAAEQLQATTTMAPQSENRTAPRGTRCVLRTLASTLGVLAALGVVDACAHSTPRKPDAGVSQGASASPTQSTVRPSAGATVLHRRRAARLVAIPAVVDTPPQAAECRLARRHLRWRYRDQRRVRDVPAARCNGGPIHVGRVVVQQRPASGRRVPIGSIVIITTALGCPTTAHCGNPSFDRGQSFYSEEPQ